MRSIQHRVPQLQRAAASPPDRARLIINPTLTYHLPSRCPDVGTRVVGSVHSGMPKPCCETGPVSPIALIAVFHQIHRQASARCQAAAVCSVEQDGRDVVEWRHIGERDGPRGVPRNGLRRARAACSDTGSAATGDPVGRSGCRGSPRRWPYRCAIRGCVVILISGHARCNLTAVGAARILVTACLNRSFDCSSGSIDLGC